MPFKDYTLREQEIHQRMCKDLGINSTDAEAIKRWKSRVPKRLRGAPLGLIERLRTLHHRCSYAELLRHYCPIEVGTNSRMLFCKDLESRNWNYLRNQDGDILQKPLRYDQGKTLKQAPMNQSLSSLALIIVPRRHVL